MNRFILSFLVFGIMSCSKNEQKPVTPDVIPADLDGLIIEFNLTPVDINTPDKGTFFIAVNNTTYQVDFDITSQAASNAIIKFDSDTILNDQSREFANLGKDAVAYNPLANNRATIFFNNGHKIIGGFNLNTSFGGVFGEALISQWRTPGDPGKPTQKAKDDIIHLVHLYADKDGAGPGTIPQYVFAKVSRR